MNEESRYLAKRLADLSRQAASKGIVTFSDFLTAGELMILEQNKDRLDTGYRTYGGYEYAERQMAAFLPDAHFYAKNDAISDESLPDYPIRRIRVMPLHQKFAEKLTHRDLLGALMSLGFERAKLGDIIIDDSAEPPMMLFFAREEIVPYILENLASVRHTSVSLSVEEGSADYRPKVEEASAVAASNRLDAVVAAICKQSRSATLGMIKDGKISVNGIECLHNTYYCKPSDLISIRGFGKARFIGEAGATRKDRMRFKYEIFI